MKAEYIDHLGNDLTVVNAARVSMNKESEYEVETRFWDHDEGFPSEAEEEKMLSEGFDDMTDPDHWTTVWQRTYLKEGDKKLINYLAKHNHWTPFSHAQITLRETVPIFVARQRFKHMIGFTYNEISKRYVDDTPEFYYPEQWRKRPDKSIKQGSGDVFTDYLYTEESHGVDTPPEDVYEYLMEQCKEVYETMIERGIAPEMARMVLPQSMMTSYFVTGSLAAFARAYKLRIDDHSQYEIQVLAKQWEEIIAPLYPESWYALINA